MSYKKKSPAFTALSPRMKKVVRCTGPENVEEFHLWCEYWKEHLKEVIEKLHAGWDDQHVPQETWQLVMELRRYCVRHDAEIFEDDPTVYPSPDLPSQETPGMSAEDALSFFRRALEWCMQNQPPDEKQKSKRTKAEANEAVREYLLEHHDAKRDEIAKAIGCSTGLVSETPAWQAVARKRKSEGSPQRRASLQKLAKEDQRLVEIVRLTRQQDKDSESSSLDEDGEDPVCYPRM